MLMNISATMAPELPWADRIAACTRESNRSAGAQNPSGGRGSEGSTSGRASAMPVNVSSRLEPVSESDTGKTFMAFSAGADSTMIVLARRNQAVNASHTLQPYPAAAPRSLKFARRRWSGTLSRLPYAG